MGKPKAYRQPAILSSLALAILLITAGGCGSAKPRHFDSLLIRGNNRFDDQVEQALALLKTKAPDAYTIVTNNVGVILQSEHSGMQAERTPPVFQLNDRSAFYSVTWCAGVIAHDSFHSKLYHDYQHEHRGAVPDAVWIGRDAETNCLAHQLRVLQEIGAADNEITYCKTVKPDYADVSYGKRDW